MSSRTISIAASASHPSALRLLTLAFFLSGSSSLIYQVIWQRMLGLFAGADSTSAALVVGAFLLGLGIGSLAGSYVADRLSARNAIAGYAACEIAIALFALASPWFFHDFVVGELDDLAANRATTFFVCFAGLLLPTLLMGMSTPLVARAVVETLESAASRIGLLYGANTFGAGAGAFAGGWWLAGRLGFEGALWVGAGLNIAAVALAILVIVRAMGAPRAAPAAAPVPISSSDGPPAFSFVTWCWLMFLSGFFIVALEIVWVRVLGVIWQQTAYSFSFILAVFLVADGLGLMAGGWITRRIRDTRPAFFMIQAFAALHAIAAFLAIYWIYGWTPFSEIMKPDVLRFQGGGLLVSMFLTIMVVAPPAYLLGMSFPFVQHAVQRDLARVGERVGLVQLANIVGNAAGSVVTGLLLLDLLGSMGTLKTAIVLAAVLLFFWSWLVFRQGGAERRLGAAGIPGLFAMALIALAAASPDNRQFWSSIHRQSGESPGYVSEDKSGLAYLRVEIGRDGVERSRMFIGGFTQSHIPFFAPHLFLGAVGPLLHPAPEDVLVIGVGSGGTPYAAGINPATRSVTAIELVRPVYDVLRDYVSDRPDSAVNKLFTDPRYRLVTGDGRREIFIKDERYDVIQSDAILPEMSHSGLLYSREFFELARDALKPGGFYVMWAPTQRNLATFTAVFSHVVHLRPVSVVIGSMTPIAFDPGMLAARFADPAVIKHVTDASGDLERIKTLFSGPSRTWSAATPRGGGQINTDLFPKDEFYLNNGLISANQAMP